MGFVKVTSQTACLPLNEGGWKQSHRLSLRQWLLTISRGDYGARIRSFFSPGNTIYAAIAAESGGNYRLNITLPNGRTAAHYTITLDEMLTAEEVREYCQGKIAHFKIPQYVRIVESFPMTVTGKVQKFRIRQMEIEALGLEGQVAATA